MSFDFKKELMSTPIAHRGYFNEIYPENSMGAMQRAVDNNFSIELDIQLSKDNQVVVFHDNDLKRVCGVDKMVKELDYSELQQLSLLDTNSTIPLFEEVLKVVDGKVLLVIELKSISGNNTLLVDKTIEILNKYEGKFVVQSFDPTIVAQFKKKAPHFIRGLLVSNMKDSGKSKIINFLLRNMLLNFLAKPYFINTSFDYLTGKMKRWHKRKPLICYTARNVEQYEYSLKIYDAVIFEGFDPIPLFEKYKKAY